MALDRILENKRAELATKKAARPLAELSRGLTRSARSLEAALARPHCGYIMECKRASPSRGQIRTDYDPAAIARAYAPFADAISVLIDERFFQGSLDHLSQVSGAVDLPVLAKEFVLEPYQIFEARRAGADAVLLMMAVLDDGRLQECLAACLELGLDALVEVHDEAELERAIVSKARILGINNRDLKTLQVDLATTARLAPMVPADRLLVAESGLRDHRDALRLRDRVHAFLVGSALMARSDLDAATRQLVHGQVKVCGLTRPQDARAAEAAGAVFGGLIFANKSPRRVSAEQAEAIVRTAGLMWVGVFVDATPERVAELAHRLGLFAVQLHGAEPASYAAQLRVLLPEGCQVWKALGVAGLSPDLESAAWADRILLDTSRGGSGGGTGQTFDWKLLEDLDLSRLVIAGGLGPHNADGADRLGAWALDVNSGVERSPGIKDERLMGNFFAKLRGKGRGRME
jgi:indole-3-glycerol phosphate synthase/phosphoribosylanthranilate isomerase